MGRYLVVAHQTAASPELVSRLREIASLDTEAVFVLLVPMTPLKHLLTWQEGDSEEIAHRRASEAAFALRQAGLTVSDAIVGPEDPLLAITREHERQEVPYERTIIGTLPAGISRWLGRDLPNQLRSRLPTVVVEVIEAKDRTAGAQRSPRPVSISLPFAGQSTRSLAALAQWIGTELYSRDAGVGEIREVIYDYATWEPVWLGIASRPLPFRTFLVPAQRVVIEDGRLETSLTRESILGQPPTELGEGFASLSDEEKLYAYFGLPHAEMRDIRVLRSGEELPGGETNWQNILEPEASISSAG